MSWDVVRGEARQSLPQGHGTRRERDMPLGPVHGPASPASGAKPRRRVFSVTHTGSVNCLR
jgi:hypothetical protein